MDTQIFVAFAGYLIVLMIIGFLAHRKHTTAADFLLGARSLNYWVTAISAHASDMSSWLFMAFPMAVFTGGMPSIWIGLGLISGMWMTWQFIAPALRIHTEEHNSYTLCSYLESRFEDSSGLIRLLSAGVTLLFITHYLAAGLISMGFLFESLFGINYHVGISIATAVVLSYTFFGGFVAVAWVDLFQGLFLLAMILLVPCVAWGSIQGWEGIELAALAKGVSMQILPSGIYGWGGALMLGLSWGLGYFGMPQVLVKFMGIRHVSEMVKAKRVGMIWQILSLSASACIGLIGIAYFQGGGLGNEELVFVEMVKDLFPPFLVGLILCGVIAATISTMDSQILVVSSVIAEDLYHKFFQRSANSKKILMVSRASVVGVSLLALFVAFSANATVYDSVFYAWSGLGCSFGPVMILALHCPSVNRWGGIAGLLLGSGFPMIWSLAAPEWLQATPAIVPGFFLTLATIYGVSKVTSAGACHR